MYLSMNDSGITLETIMNFAGGVAHGTPDLSLTAFGISIDSRSVKKGDAFIALRGDRFDGHDFLNAAQAAGAVFAVVERVPDGVSIPCIVVDDTRAALGRIACSYKKYFRTISVAVTGSVGKTTTKQFIYSVLDTKYKTNESKGNHNNEIGMPMTLLELTAEHKALVVEMGMNHRGEISYLSQMAEPDISVITGIGTAHIEHLGSREAIRDAKLEILDGMKPGGILIVNGDEPLLCNVEPNGVCKITVGVENENCVYNAENIRAYEEHMLFDIRLHDGEIMNDVRVNVIGKHNIYNALFACVCGILLGVPEEKIRQGLLDFAPIEMRQHVEQRNGITIIEDCYNANPESMKAGLNVLHHIAKSKNLRPVAVLGDMLELGEFSEEAHSLLGSAITEFGIEHLITFGKAAVDIASGAIASGVAKENVTVIEDIEDAEKAATVIKSILREGDAVLFKASRALAMERIIQLL